MTLGCDTALFFHNRCRTPLASARATLEEVDTCLVSGLRGGSGRISSLGCNLSIPEDQLLDMKANFTCIVRVLEVRWDGP